MNKVPAVWSDVAGHLRRLANAINELVDGKSNATGSVTLTNSATTTTVINERCSSDSVVLLMPKSAASAAEAWHIAPANGQFVITHSNDVTTRSFGYVISTP